MTKPAVKERESRAIRTERERLTEVGAAAAYSALVGDLARRVGIEKVTDEDDLESAEPAWKFGYHFAWERLKNEPSLGSGDE